MKTYLTESSESLLVTNEWGTYATFTKPQVVRAYIAESKGPKGYNYVRHGKWLRPFEGALCDSTGATWPTGGVQPSQVQHTKRWHLFDATQYADDALVASAKQRFDSTVITSQFGPNEFELLPFLFDLDSTFNMFSAKFLRDLSYGSVTWGILPFISDAKSLVKSVKDIMLKAGNYQRSVNRYSQFAVPGVKPTPSGQLVFARSLSLITRRLSGTVTTKIPNTEPLDRALFLLDELGVHPDLSTLWDVLPLSFVIDYFIPIGDILQSYHPRGWANHLVTFDGTVSSKEKHFYSAFYVAGNGDFGIGSDAIFSYYERSPLSNYSPQLVGTVDWKSPSPKEIFNTAYLTTALKRFF